MPRLTKTSSLIWAIVLSMIGILLFAWNAGGCGFTFLLIGGVFWGIWGMKLNRDTKLAQGGVAATLPPPAMAQLNAAPTIEAAPPMHSKGVDGLFVPPPLN